MLCIYVPLYTCDSTQQIYFQQMQSHPRLAKTSCKQTHGGLEYHGISYKHAGHSHELMKLVVGELQERHRVSLPPALRQQILQMDPFKMRYVFYIVLLFWYFVARIPL